MPRIADYSVITDLFTTLKIGDNIDQDFDFTLESGAHLGSKSILAFVVLVPKEAVDIKLEVKVNGEVQQTYVFNGSPRHTLHEVINPDVLRTGTNNVEFRVIGGKGFLQFSDLVLHYQRDI